MLPDGLVTYSTIELEELARSTLTRRIDIEFCAPINVEMLIENEKNVELQLMDGLRNHHKVEGCVCKRFMSHTLTVLIDSLVFMGPWARYNAVLGEEFAHLRLHPAIPLFVESVEDFIALQHDPQWPQFEADARRFSAAIRMPVTLVTAETAGLYPRVINDLGFGNPSAIETALKNRLAERFRVTPDEMQNRLSSAPCNLRERVLTSIQARELELVDPSYVLKISHPLVQRRLDADFRNSD